MYNRSESNPLSLITPTFQNLIDTEDPIARELTLSTLGRIGSQEVIVKTNKEVHAPTAFNLEGFLTPKGLIRYQPTLFINPDFVRMLSHAAPSLLNSDLVKTMFIMDQFPNRGYQRRLAQVYQSAAQTEEGFLIRMGKPAKSVDPKLILSPSRVYMDFGYADLQKTIGDCIELMEEPSAIERVQALGAISPDSYVITRQGFWDMQDMKYSQSETITNLQYLSEDARASKAALNFVYMGLIK